jgi:hypothetical protein
MSEFQGAGEPLTRVGFIATVESLGLKVPELLAVLSVETHGCGFLSDRSPAILFERHVFHRLTKGKFDAKAPSLSNTQPGGYLGGLAEYGRLAAAIQLNRTAALQSASWGIGQVMGFNFATAGYQNVEDMVRDSLAGEDRQLQAMANFLKANGLQQSLAIHDWTSFARGYNGPGFARNHYDVSLASAFRKFVQGPLPDILVRTAQLLLTYAGLHVGMIDGVAGKLTRSAASQFRQDHGIPASDEIDEDLVAALRSASPPPPTPKSMAVSV